MGSIIVSEIGDIERFETSSKLVAYVGLDASVKQSGEFNSTQNKISKRGSPYLRRALWMTAFMSLQCDPALYDYYSRLRARGKSHRLATTAVVRKLCIIVGAIMKSKQPYSPQFNIFVSVSFSAVRIRTAFLLYVLLSCYPPLKKF